MSETATRTPPPVGIMAPTPAPTRQIPYGDSLYNQAMHFLIEEAFALDTGQFNEWLTMLADDVRTTVPVRQSVHSARGTGFSSDGVWVREDLGSLSFKVSRLYTDAAYNEDPPSRTRRIVTNLRLHETAVADEYLAQNYLRLYRTRGDTDVFEFSARRDDVLRRTADGWKLSHRTVLMDQAVVGMPNMAVFL